MSGAPDGSWAWVSLGNYIVGILAALGAAVMTGLTMAWRGGAAMARAAEQMVALNAKIDAMHAEVTKRQDDLKSDIGDLRKDIRDEREAIRAIEKRVSQGR